MGANRLVFVCFIIAVIIKNGFTKPDAKPEQRFKPVFPKIMITSTSPPTVLNSTLSSNSTLEPTNDLQNEKLNDSASIFLSKFIQPPFYAPPIPPIDPQLPSKRYGSFGNLPVLSNPQVPYLINPFGWVPVFLAGPLNPLRTLRTVLPHPFSVIFNRIHSFIARPSVPVLNPNSEPPHTLNPDIPNPIIAHQRPKVGAYDTVQKKPPFAPSYIQQNYLHTLKEASLAHKVPIQLLMGTHSFKNALQNFKSPSGQSFKEQTTISVGHPVPGFIYSPPELLPSSRNVTSANVSDEIGEISDSVVESEASLTSNSTKITVSNNIIGTTNISDNIALNNSVSFISNLTAVGQSQTSAIRFPFERAYAPGSYYLAPHIVTQGRTQSPGNSDQHNVEPSPRHISHQSTQEKQDSAAKKFEFEMEKGNSKPSDPESSNEAAIPNLQVAVVDVSSIIDGDSKNQNLATSTVGSSQISTSQKPEVTEKRFSESTKSLEHDIFKNQIYTTSSTSTTATEIVSKKSQEHRKSTNSIKAFTPFPFLRIKPKAKITQVKKSTAASTIASSQSAVTERLLYAQYLPSAIIGHANKTL